MNSMDDTQLAQAIDHTLLKPTATREAIHVLCQEARTFGFCSVCIAPRWIGTACEHLLDTPVKVAGVIGFPLGFESTPIKVAQAKEAVLAGADEIDMVADLAAVIEADTRYLEHQLRAVLKVCRSMRPAVALKVIIESAALTHEQKRLACHVADAVCVDFVKTSTGLHPAGGATLDDVRLLKAEAPHCRVKAAGGIRTARQALDMLAAGASRIGTSAGVAIINELRSGNPQ